jgi:hypothetical protein
MNRRNISLLSKALIVDKENLKALELMMNKIMNKKVLIIE